MRRTPIARRMSTTRRASTVRMASARPLLEERSQGRCDICCWPLQPSIRGFEFQAHHRLSRARGGDDSPANLLACCVSCHQSIHSRVKRSEDNGWILPSGSFPDECSVSFRGQGAFLTAEGQVLWIDPDALPTSTEDF